MTSSKGEVEALLGDVKQFLRGTRHPAEVNRVLATAMFTDLVETTPRALRLGDHRWTLLLDDHDAAVDRAIATHRGRRVKHTGDGVLAMFDGAARAVRCAAAIRSRVRELGLSVRAGLHADEVEQRHGDDVGGLAVHIAARVMNTAEPNQIVRGLVAGCGIEFAELGRFALRGVPGELNLFTAAL